MSSDSTQSLFYFVISRPPHLPLVSICCLRIGDLGEVKVEIFPWIVIIVPSVPVVPVPNMGQSDGGDI